MTRVAIIGAGLGGIACAVNLTRAGLRDFTVFEKASGPGGVWWHNTYPGCEVDVNSQAYSYSFMPYVWSRTHATQPEVQRYVEDVIDHFGIRPHLEFGVAVERVTWDEETRTYTVEDAFGELGRFDLVVSCVGMLSKPRVPSWARNTSFPGPIFHTAEYRHDVPLDGRRVAIVGTGSTASQLVPALAATAGSLDVYQREPGYVLPKRAREFTDDEQRAYRDHPRRQRLDRWRLLRQAAKDSRAFDTRSAQQQRIRDYHSRYLDREVADPAVRESLRPDYAYGCKRPVFASTFYGSFNDPRVTLVSNEVVSLGPEGLRDATGAVRGADVVILATGFEATRYLADLDVVGAGGCRLHDVWAGTPSAFLGMSVPGFPNFLMLYGPNTNGGWSICAQLERQSELVVRVAKRLARRGTFDTRPGIAARYDAWIQRALHRRRGAFEAGCHNYYRTASGKNVTQWPYGHVVYAAATRLLPIIGFRRARTRQGRRQRP